MNLKDKIRHTYNISAKDWHKTRTSSLENDINSKYFKQNRPHLFIEKPAMFAKVPDLKGKTALCLGCGSGEECGFLIKKNPKKLIGIDLSSELISIAKKSIRSARFYTMDAEDLKFKDNSFDFIYSSLVLKYFKSWSKVLREVYRVLKNGGVFLFSNFHPVKWSAYKKANPLNKSTSVILGYEKSNKGCKQIIYGNYLNTTIHKEVWVTDSSLYFYTKPISKMFKEITNSGFIVTDIDEPKAIPETKKYYYNYWLKNQKIPSFIIFECVK